MLERQLRPCGGHSFWAVETLSGPVRRDRRRRLRPDHYIIGGRRHGRHVVTSMGIGRGRRGRHRVPRMRVGWSRGRGHDMPGVRIGDGRGVLRVVDLRQGGGG